MSIPTGPGQGAEAVDFPDYLSVVAIARNEGLHLREWLEYHLLVGVQRFYFYDNASTDNTRELLEPYIRSGTVVYRLVTGSRMQLLAYADAIGRCRSRTRWLAMIDLDELIVPLDADSLPELLREYEGYPALGINWVMFDSNGHDEPPREHDALMAANYTTVRRGSHDPQTGDRHIKSIVSPREVVMLHNPHGALYKGKRQAVDENFEPITGPRTARHSSRRVQVNHYYTCSRAEYQRKMNTPRSDNGELRTFNEEMLNFPDPDRDDAIARFLPGLRARLGLVR